jgi:hypothetical protein
MRDMRRRVTRLEQVAGDEVRIKAPLIYRPGETPAETLARYGLTAADIEGQPTVWLPETEGQGDELRATG